MAWAVNAIKEIRDWVRRCEAEKADGGSPGGPLSPPTGSPSSDDSGSEDDAHPGARRNKRRRTGADDA